MSHEAGSIETIQDLHLLTNCSDCGVISDVFLFPLKIEEQQATTFKPTCHKEHNLRHTELYWALPPPPTTRFRKCVSQELPGPLWANHTKRKENKVETKAAIQAGCLHFRQCKYSCWRSNFVPLWLTVEKQITSAKESGSFLALTCRCISGFHYQKT